MSADKAQRRPGRRGLAADRFDVIVVGARCAGASLATLLARQGAKVAVVEQAQFPRDTLSSHVIQTDALAFLRRLGVMEQVQATGARFMSHVDARLGDARVLVPYPQLPGDVGGAACIRRFIFDPILADAAAAAGAHVHMATKVVGLVEEDGRVAGVRVVDKGSERVLRAKLVVGADGRSSTIARLCGARSYNVRRNERTYYWSFFEGAELSGEPTFVLHRWGDRFVFGGPADSGLYIVGISPEAGERDDFRRTLERSFMDHANSCEPVAATIAGATRATKIFGIRSFSTYFREGAGRGWVLAGDAGHFKDPAVGRGIGDAFLQADALAPIILDKLDAQPAVLDRALRRWVRWRDREFAGHYWLGADIGKAGAVPTPVPEVIRRLHANGRTERFIELFSHRRDYSNVFSPPAVIDATARLLVRGGCDRPALLREVGGLLAEDTRRRWVNVRPVFAPPAPRDIATAVAAGTAEHGARVSRLPLGRDASGRWTTSRRQYDAVREEDRHGA